MAEEKLHCKVTLCLMGDKRAFGPGVAELLEGVRRHGSLQGAARDIAMSYSKAWTVMRNAEEIWGFPHPPLCRRQRRRPVGPDQAG